MILISVFSFVCVQNSDDENSMEGDSLPLLSDDEDLDEKEGESLLDSLRKGILPPEIRILYGLALIAEGGRNFLASKCLEAIEDLEQEPSEWLTAGEHETSVIGKPTWHLFRRAMTESLGRTAAYAFLADVLRKTVKEREWSVHFAPKIRKHLETLVSVGLREQLMALRGDEDVSSLVNFRKSQVLKVILATCAFDVQSVERPNLKCPVKREVVLTKDEDRVAIALSVMKTLSDVIYLVWKVEKDGSLPPICVEVSKLRWDVLSFLVIATSNRFIFVFGRFSWYRYHLDAFVGFRTMAVQNFPTISSTQSWVTPGPYYRSCLAILEFLVTKPRQMISIGLSA